MFVANWKMNGSEEKVKKWIDGMSALTPSNIQSKCIFCPPVCFLSQASNFIKDKGLNISLGAQDIDPNSFYKDEEASITGGIAGNMLKELGCQYVIIGHSERRKHYQEKDHLLLMKLLAAASQNLKIIFCIGESSEEKESGKTLNVLKKQLEVASMVTNATILVAYEPVWAIGTGKSAEVGYIEEVHGKIREELECLEIKELLGLIYGGSVKANTAKKILSLDNVDGLLVGGASLKEKEFSHIALNSTIK